MEIMLRDNIVFDSMVDERELKEKVLDFIMKSKASKILYKGNPSNINYKLMKKLLGNVGSNHPLKLHTNCSDVRAIYGEFISELGCKYCVIYKK